MVKDPGYIDELSAYVKKNLKKGYTKESLKWALVSQGHSKLEILKAIERAENELSKEAPILKSKPVITREVFDMNDIKIEPEEKKPFWKKWFG